jgi:uncharacterized protein (TIGR03086 family)
MTDIDVLESVLAKDERLIAAVTPEQLSKETPCPDYDVRTLLDHIVGWVRAFGAGANDRDHDEDPGTYHTDHPAEDFRVAAADLVKGWRDGGTDRKVRASTMEMPGEAVLAMTVMEYVTHGTDLARATGQPIPFTDDEIRTAFEHAKNMLPPEYRGEGQAFGEIVPVPDDAPLRHRFLGFMGRTP